MADASTKLSASWAKQSGTVLSWAAGLLPLVGISVCILFLGRSLRALQSFPSVDGFTEVLLCISVVFAMFGLLGILVNLFVGPPWHRTLKVWLAYLALVSAWCGLAVSWDSLYWYGQTQRIRTQICAYEPVARLLRTNWPEEDGSHALLNSYRVYAQGDSHTLMPPAAVTPPGARVPYVSIVRSDRRALRFQLAGSETGAWLEWHPQESSPESFESGVYSHRELIRQRELIPDWYLVRYQP